MTPRNLLASILAFVALTASSAWAPAPAEASHGGADHFVTSRITARLAADGRVEFALQQFADGAWSARIFPRARYFPTTATVDRWLASSTLSTALPRSPADADRAVVEAFYHATGGQEWWHQTNWLSSRPLGEWYGVNTDSDGRVIEISLDNNNLSGSIPPKLGDLSNLARLDLSDNALAGIIPPELGALSNLVGLWLYSNDLSGSIPPELGNLSNLVG